MALEGLNLVGASPVLGANRGIDTYARLMQQQQAKQQAEQKALADELSSIKTDGLRDADKEVFFNKYDAWRNKGIEASKERDALKKMQLQSDFQKEALELQGLVGKSKEAAKLETDFMNRLLDNRFRVQFTDDAVAKAQQNRRLPITDPNYISDYSVLDRQVDLSKIPDTINKVRDELLKTAKESSIVQDKAIRMGNRSGTEYYRKKSVPIQDQAFQIANLYDVDNDVKAYFVKKYPDLYDQLPEQQAKQQAIMAELQQYPPLEQVKRDEVWDTKGSSGDGDSNPQNYSVTQKVFSSTAEKSRYNPQTGQREDIKNPQVVSRTADKFVGSDPTTSSLPQIEKAWNVTKGGVQKFPAGDINITGVGYFRVKDGYQKLVTANDKNGNEWLFKESDVPVEAKNSKGFKAANNALGGEPADWRSNKEESGANKKAASGYKIGQVDGGYKYTGGDPTKQENWIKQ